MKAQDPNMPSSAHVDSIYKGGIEKNHTTVHNHSASPRRNQPLPCSNIPKTSAIKLIGDSFHFHVAYLFKRELEMLDSLKQNPALKFNGLNNPLFSLENA